MTIGRSRTACLELGRSIDLDGCGVGSVCKAFSDVYLDFTLPLLSGYLKAPCSSKVGSEPMDLWVKDQRIWRFNSKDSRDTAFGTYTCLTMECSNHQISTETCLCSCSAAFLRQLRSRPEFGRRVVG